jgi:hypothetical protein
MLVSAKMAVVLGIVSATTVVACSSETVSAGDAPAVESDAIDERDEGTSYDGWSQFAIVIEDCYPGEGGYWGQLQHTLSRSSGSSTRGGGACNVVYNGTSCSSDATCTSIAQSAYGSGAYGYCYSGACYSRPGSAVNNCVTNPNRSPGTVTGTSMPGTHVVGCMTKGGGPNTACGGTDTSQYMRTMASHWFYCL